MTTGQQLVPATGGYRPMLRVGDFLTQSAQRFPDRCCFRTGDGADRTFAQVNTRVNRLAHGLAGRGVERGDRIAILAVDSPEYYEVILACLKLGAVYVPLNNKLTESEVTTLLGRAEPVALFVSARYASIARTAEREIATLGHVVAFDGSDLPAYAELLATADDHEPDVDVRDEDIVGLAFTSGTTGLPKGVLQPHGMLKNLIQVQIAAYELRLDETRYSASPAFHIAGQAIVIMQIAMGFTTYIAPQFEVRQTFEWMRSGEVTGVFLVPTMMRRILDLPDVREGDFSALQSILYGGAPMSPALLREAMEVFGCRFINAFGAGTEAGLQAVLSSADHTRALAGEEHLLSSIGRPPFGVDVRIVDAEDRDVEVGEVGEIVSRSDTVMAGYLGLPEETAHAVRGGWFHAGDLGWRDEQGYLYLAGRSKDMIIRGGENIYPVEIETVIGEFPGVAHVAVVGAPDDLWGEIVTAFVVVEGPLDEEALRRHCRTRLAGYKVPAQIIQIEQMPLNASGKILKRALRDQLAPRPADEPVAAGSPREA